MESQESKIRKGQAYNLAVNDAISSGRQGDGKYIYQQFIYYHNLATVVQSSEMDMIQEVLNRPDFEKLIREFSEYFDKEKKAWEGMK
jgi:hypothetical protein